MSAVEDSIDSQRFRYKVSGMDCASCAKTIEQGLAALPGIAEIRVDFTTETIEGRGDIERDSLRERLAALGYQLADESAPAATAPDAAASTLGGIAGFTAFLWRQRALRVAVVLGAAALATVPLEAAAAPFAAASEPIRWLVIAIVGYPIARRGLASLLYARRITIDLLMTVATLGAVAIGASGEAATVVLLFTLGEALEGYSAARSRASLGSLLALRPARATVIRARREPDGSVHRHYETVAVTELEPGDRVLVKPGERMPADGHVVAGASAVNNAAITGESAPVPAGVGDGVYAGTINGRGTLEVEVGCRAEDFTIAEIARLVEQAQARRSPAERLVDRFARWYTPSVVALAAVVATVPPVVFGAPFLGADAGSPGWLYRGLALLIVACPCALIVSIPVTVVSALTRLAHLGVLVKGGAELDALANAKVFAFDKTGTLTRGRPTVAGVRSLDCTRSAAHVDGDCAPCDDVLALAASVERGSEHPFAHAVLEAASERHVDQRYGSASQIQSHAGRGVSGMLDGRRIAVGSAALFESSERARALLDENIGADGSLMLVGRDDDVLGYIRVEDHLRDSSRTALRALKDIDPGYRLVMLTGDRRPAANEIGTRLGELDEVRSELLPEHKLAAVQALEAERGPVAMIGDGINDTPALAAARLGVAMGGAGSHQAMEIADIVLMQDDLSHLPTAVRVSRKTGRLIRENVGLSLALKLAFLALAVPGFATLWMAVVADVGATVLVTLNGMRMLRAR